MKATRSHRHRHIQYEQEVALQKLYKSNNKTVQVLTRPCYPNIVILETRTFRQ